MDSYINYLFKLLFLSKIRTRGFFFYLWLPAHFWLDILVLPTGSYSTCTSISCFSFTSKKYITIFLHEIRLMLILFLFKLKNKMSQIQAAISNLMGTSGILWNYRSAAIVLHSAAVSFNESSQFTRNMWIEVVHSKIITNKEKKTCDGNLVSGGLFSVNV